MSETRPADPGARRRLLIIGIIVALIGASVISGMPSIRSALMGWINSEGGDPLDRALFVLRGLGVLLSVLLLLPAVYSWLIALRIDASGEFPPPGMKLVREAKVLRGNKALGRAWLLRAFAIKFALLAVASGVIIWVLADTLLR